MIYVAIAGSYTPVVLTLMNNWFGYLIIAIQWEQLFLVFFIKIFARKVNERFSLILYLIMGWLVVAIPPAIISQTNPIFWTLMVSGGLCYTVGAGFMLRRNLLPHDLASLHSGSFSSPIHRHCLLYVEKKLGEIPTSSSYLHISIKY